MDYNMKGMNLLKFAAVLITAAILFPGCNKDKDQELRDQEIKLLQKYIEENNITQEPTASGLYYLSVEEGTGAQIEKDFYVDLEFIVELLDGTVLYTSNEDLAKESNIYHATVLYGPVRLQAGNTGVPGLDEGLLLMKGGGKARLIMPSDINGYGGIEYGLSPAYSTHIWTIELIHAFNDPESFENDQISQYLADQGITDPLITASGLYYIESQAGEGELIQDGNVARVWYTGSFLDGRVFASNIDKQSISIVLPATGYIAGLGEAIKLMRKGTRATVIIPYDLAYGEFGNGDGTIPPYMTLVFELEIENVDTSN
jgi:FKBP-type peptidyl-prolyl cis-trans isomerase